MLPFNAKSLVLVRGKLFIAAKMLIIVGILGQESSFAKDRKSVDKVFLLGKRLDVAHQLITRNAIERVLDLGFQVSVDVDSVLELVDSLSVISMCTQDSAPRAVSGGVRRS